jgi:SAM-dependent methyltransferase
VKPVDAWADNLDEELDFWRSALGDPGPDGAVQRDRATPRAVWNELRRRVPPEADPVRMLDVGSGPLTTLGTLWPERTVEVVATDPLADQYNQLLESLGITPPVPALAIQGEQLSRHLERGSFHVVHASNSLDHTADPVVTLQEMLAVVAPGGTVCLLHHIDVGELEGYHGLHQWNLRPTGAHDMEIWNPSRRHLLSEIAPGAVIDIEEAGDGLFRVWLTAPGA